jgi:uncharacterized protein (TIGR01777 family)
MTAMRILVSGAGGLVGKCFTQEALERGHEVVALTRGASGEGRVHWDPMDEAVDAKALEGFDAVLHLAGENIASGRWTAERKKLILESRVKGTGLLTRALASLKKPPKVFVAASGSNYYADNRGGPPWDESGEAGSNFLAEVCFHWEAATTPAHAAGIRVVNARMGAVLSTSGGLLTRMLPAVCSGLGGTIGSGRQRLSWIHEADLAAAYLLAMECETLTGPVNFCAPESVSNRFLTKAVAGALHRPNLLVMPAAAVRWIYGEMGEALLLADNAIIPRKLTEAGMKWKFPDLNSALDDLLAQGCGCR